MSKVHRIRGRFDRVRRTVVEQEVSPNLLTKQEFRDECDVNLIVARAQKGVAPRFMARGVPQFGDFSAVPTVAEAHDVVMAATEAFMDLPSALRRELGNDPRRINEIDLDMARRHGLLRDNPELAASLKASSSSSAGQAGPDGPEPSGAPVKGANSPSKKGGSSTPKASSTDQSGQD